MVLLYWVSDRTLNEMNEKGETPFFCFLLEHIPLDLSFYNRFILHTLIQHTLSHSPIII